MNKKRIIGALLATSIGVSAAFTGCSLVSSNNTADMLQTIATVNISEAEGLSKDDSELIEKFKDAVGTTEIYKNELIAYYLNVGASYVNSGQSYSQVFNTLVDGLVENAVITQYAIMYLLNDKAATSSAETVLSAYNAKDSYVSKLEYLLTDDSSDDPEKEIKIAKYNLYSSLNSAIDSYEQEILTEDDTAAGSDSRTTPTGVDVIKDDYYPAVSEGENKGELDYNVYTGYKGYQLADSGVYQEDALEGSTKVTRKKAYSNFMNTLISNGLVDPYEDDLLEITTKVGYIQDEYASQLENRVINKYYDLYEKEKESKLTDDGKYDYIDAVYQKLTNIQDKNSDNFSSTLSNISDTSFILYSPNTEGEGTYGYVYNILLPFSATQSANLSALQTKYADSDMPGGYKIGYYNERNKLMEQIKTTDQRAAWFNGTTDYSFNAAEAGLEAGSDYYAGENERAYLFFENNLTKNDKYEPIDKYIGGYAYNGRVYETEEGGYQLIPEKLSIDGMLKEFKAYIDYVLGAEKVNYEIKENYYDPLTEDNLYTAETKDKAKVKDREIDYTNFIYANGKVELPEYGATFNANLLNKDSDQYKALAAVNELQYAYTTDTGVLSQYIGYSVTLGDTTGYIKEFEKAAQLAIAEGAGTFTVCAGDYGWHLIYVTYTFNKDGGSVYGEPNWEENIDKEGTFENLFYEFIKNNDIAEISTTRRTQIMTQFNIEEVTVTKYQSAYQDLLDLDADS